MMATRNVSISDHLQPQNHSQESTKTSNTGKITIDEANRQLNMQAGDPLKSRHK